MQITLISIWSLSLLACSGDDSELVQFINNIKTRKEKQIGPLPEFIPLPIFIFPQKQNRRNPFKPVERKNIRDFYAPDQNRKKQVLETYSLDSLEFVGTIKRGEQQWALIKLPDQQINRISVGEYMGENYGRVLKIHNDFITLKETVHHAGKWEMHIIKINLYTGKQELR